MPQHTVIIIGGGMAGVKAALDLYHAGELNTVILEARDRLAGRLLLKPATLDRSVCYDLGASWFHDALKNPLFDKAQQLGNVSYFFDDGKHQYVSEECKDIPTWSFERVVEEIGSFCELLYEDKPKRADMSVHELATLYLAHKRHLLTPAEARYAQQVVRMWIELWDGISWDEASAKQTFCDSVSHAGRNAFVTNGFATVFDNELRELPQWYRERNIKLGTQVRSIDYLLDKLVTVTTATGEQYTAQYVIVTAPPSVLRITDPVDECYIAWNPPLPSRLTLLWPDAEFGSLGKVVFEFDECFWPQDVHRFYCLASTESPDGVAEPWKHPTLIVNYMPMKGVPSLVCLTQAPVSRQVERMSADAIWALFAPVIAQIATLPVKKPFNVLHTQWNQDPFTRGAYSAGRVHAPDCGDVCDALAQGVSNRVRIAGADTVSGRANGCAHGAWFSGEREARHILKQLTVAPKI